MKNPHKPLRGILSGVLPFLLIGLLAGPLSAQSVSGPYDVLIPDFMTSDGVDRDVGRDMAEALRKRFDNLPTHRAIPRDEIRDQAKDLDLQIQRMDCAVTRQLAGRMGAQVALCAQVEPADGDNVRVTAAFWDLGSGTSFEVPPFQEAKRNRAAAADRILESFQTYVDQTRSSRFCLEYAQVGDRGAAMTNCARAIQLNPGDTRALLARARLYVESEDWAQALDDLDRVLEVDPMQEEALQLAGWVAVQSGQDEQGRDYYRRYLRLQPQAVDVRRRVAYELFEAGDPQGAMELIADGLAVAANGDLLLDYGNYAFSAASDEGLPKGERDELLRSAVDAHLQAYQELGAEMSASALRNVLTALVQLERPEEAVTEGARFVETHPDDPQLWVALAQARKEAGDMDGAMDALDRVAELNPDFPDLHVRRVVWLLEAGRQGEAIKTARSMDLTDAEASEVARALLADAHNRGVKNDRWAYALTGIEAARAVDRSADDPMMRFWNGYVLLRRAQELQEPQTVESARTTLPLFQRAHELMAGTQAYTRTQPSINLPEFLENAQAYIEIQEAIIKKGNRGRSR